MYLYFLLYINTEIKKYGGIFFLVEEEKDPLSGIVGIIAVDDLPTQGARALIQ